MSIDRAALGRDRSNGVSSWIVPGERAKRADVRVICFCSAGGSAFQFKQWDKLASDRTEFLGIQIPGHDERCREPLMRRVDAIVRLPPADAAGFGLPR
jgi:hypothetical protein